MKEKTPSTPEKKVYETVEEAVVDYLGALKQYAETGSEEDANAAFDTEAAIMDQFKNPVRKQYDAEGKEYERGLTADLDQWDKFEDHIYERMRADDESREQISGLLQVGNELGLDFGSDWLSDAETLDKRNF